MTSRKWILALLSAAIIGAVAYLSRPSDDYTARETAEREGMAILTDLFAVLESIQDRESARQAAPRIDALSNRLEAFVKKAPELPIVSREEHEAIKKKLYAEMGRTDRQMFEVGQQAARNSQREPAFVAAIDRFEAAMTKAKQLDSRVK